MAATTRSTQVGLQSRNIFSFAEAMGSDVVTVAKALDASGLRLQRDTFGTPRRVLELLDLPASENGKKRKR